MPSLGSWEDISFSNPTTDDSSNFVTPTKKKSSSTNDKAPQLQQLVVDASFSNSPSESSMSSSSTTGGEVGAIMKTNGGEEQVTNNNNGIQNNNNNGNGSYSFGSSSQNGTPIRKSSTTFPKERKSVQSPKRRSRSRGRSRTPVRHRVPRKAKSNPYKDCTVMNHHHHHHYGMYSEDDETSSHKSGGLGGGGKASRPSIRHEDYLYDSDDGIAVAQQQQQQRRRLFPNNEPKKKQSLFVLDENDPHRYSVVIDKVFNAEGNNDSRNQTASSSTITTIKPRSLDFSATSTKPKPKKAVWKSFRDWILFFVIVAGCFYLPTLLEELGIIHPFIPEESGPKRWAPGKKQHRHVDHMPHLSMAKFWKALQNDNGNPQYQHQNQQGGHYKQHHQHHAAAVSNKKAEVPIFHWQTVRSFFQSATSKAKEAERKNLLEHAAKGVVEMEATAQKKSEHGGDAASNITGEGTSCTELSAICQLAPSLPACKGKWQSECNL